MKTDRKISEETSMILEAFEKILQAEDIVLRYYHHQWGENSDLWDKSEERENFEKLGRSIKLLLGDSIEVNLSDLSERHI